MPSLDAFKLDKLPAELFLNDNRSILTNILRGVEKESLRVDPNGKMSSRGHPEALGSALTHPQITTDFSEALVEFITPPSHNIATLLAQLKAVHNYTYHNIGDESLWCSSMPCAVGQEQDIPVALYGSSNRAKMKTTYRVGLGHRYGRVMQTVAGLHYNFSLPNTLWAFLHQKENAHDDLPSFITRRYFDLIRNFRRSYWLLIYLFGASPAVCRSFVKNRDHQLQPLGQDDHTLHLPYATSLRMGDLGYQSKAQESLFVCYNGLNTYLRTLINAIRQPYAAYDEIGLQDELGQYKQLNTSLLQIENEFYSAIRPKRTARAGETAITALCNRGVEYIEVRCLDLNPFEPLGVSASQMRFLDTFLVYCLLLDSPDCSRDEYQHIAQNQKRVVNEGRKPGLELSLPSGESVTLKQWASTIVKAMEPVAELLDHCNNDEENSHQQALGEFAAKIEDPERLPSARILAELKNGPITYHQWALRQSRDFRMQALEDGLSDSSYRRLEDMAIESLALQKEEESHEQTAFDEYLKEYYQQYNICCSKVPQLKS